MVPAGFDSTVETYCPPGPESVPSSRQLAVESLRAVDRALDVELSDPHAGRVREPAAKHGVVEEPEKVNEDPYGEGWLIRVRLSDPAEADGLLDVEAYKALLEDQ